MSLPARPSLPAFRATLLAFAVACATAVEPTDPPADTSDPLDALRLTELQEVNAEHGSTSEVCYWCHANTNRSASMRDAAGNPISPWDLWRGSMMAMSSRDPFFRAAVSVEQAAFPDQAQTIGQECMRCHAPAAFAEATLTDTPLPGPEILVEETELGILAKDGATCVACHLLDPGAAGARETWSGHHAYDPDRRLYGPHADPFAAPMEGFASYTPTFHENYGSSGMCASCHMLQTEALDPSGATTGHTLTEQAPFVEWRSSAFAGEDGQTCQECHLPQVDASGAPLRTKIARSAGGFDSSRIDPREPIGRHLMVGGNAFALEVIYDHRFDLGVSGPGPSIATAIEETRLMLASSASLSTQSPSFRGDVLVLPVTVTNHVGHKLPTGYPTRRMWLEVRITDATGEEVVHIGGVDAQGRIVGGSGEPLPSERPGAPLEPHRQRITGADTPIVWQSWMQTAEGEPTTRLLRGATYQKDNRLLPAGFSPSVEDAPLVASIGVDGDTDFLPGSDTVVVETPLRGAGPWTAELRVRYQSWSPRSLDDLLAVPTPETRGLAAMLDGRGVPAEVLAELTIEVAPGD